MVNFDAISKAIIASREESVENSTEKLNANTRRKSLFDKIIDYILKKFIQVAKNTKFRKN